MTTPTPEPTAPEPATPAGEPVVNPYGVTIAVLHWRDNRDGATTWAKIDNGTLIRRPDGTVTVQLQDQTTGDVRSYEMPDTVTAFYALGLCAGRCNGINGWLAFSLGFGGGGD